MKRFLSIFFASATICLIVAPAQSHATLYLRGTDSLDNRLIYDSDLDITWYDYTNTYANWQDQVNWAAGLTVDFAGTVYDDWRLPSTVDGPYVYGTDGTITGGYNITNSEMGHLFYVELGNQGLFDTSGAYAGNGNWGLINRGFFQSFVNLSTYYWSGTEYATDSSHAWAFNFASGNQRELSKGMSYAFAVRPGDVAAAAPVPEPSTMLLMGSGLAGLAFWRRFRKG